MFGKEEYHSGYICGWRTVQYLHWQISSETAIISWFWPKSSRNTNYIIALHNKKLKNSLSVAALTIIPSKTNDAHMTPHGGQTNQNILDKLQSCTVSIGKHQTLHDLFFRFDLQFAHACWFPSHTCNANDNVNISTPNKSYISGLPIRYLPMCKTLITVMENSRSHVWRYSRFFCRANRKKHTLFRVSKFIFSLSATIIQASLYQIFLLHPNYIIFFHHCDILNQTKTLFHYLVKVVRFHYRVVNC